MFRLVQFNIKTHGMLVNSKLFWQRFFSFLIGWIFLYQDWHRMCTGREKLTPESVEFEGQLQYVSDAVLAFANAFKCVPFWTQYCWICEKQDKQKKKHLIYARDSESSEQAFITKNKYIAKGRIDLMNDLISFFPSTQGHAPSFVLRSEGPLQGNVAHRWQRTAQISEKSRVHRWVFFFRKSI